MTAVFNWAQTAGAVPGTKQNLGSSGNLINFKNIDSIGIADYAANPVPAGANSFEVWLQGNFSGSFGAVRDVRFWMSQGFTGTGFTIKAKTSGQTDYGQPTNVSSSIATANVVTPNDPGTANVSISGSLTSSLTAPGYTDYIVLQLQTTTAAPAGDTTLATFNLSYIEL